MVHGHAGRRLPPRCGRDRYDPIAHAAIVTGHHRLFEGDRSPQTEFQHPWTPRLVRGKVTDLLRNGKTGLMELPDIDQISQRHERDMHLIPAADTAIGEVAHAGRVWRAGVE